MHIRRTLPLISALVLSSSLAFAQSDVPPVAPEAPVDQAPAPEAPPPAPMAPAPAPAIVAPTFGQTPPTSTSIVPAAPSFKLDLPGGSSVKVGFLLQPQFQANSSTALSGYEYNLYIRRTRFILGGTLFGVIDYFFDTDFASLNLANAETGIKATPGMNIQDAFATAKPYGDFFKIDAGYMLPPLAHNALQSAASLYSYDYFSNSFNSTANTLLGSSASPVGRDTGVQLRGLVLDGHIEYRAGLFQGIRNPPAEDTTMTPAVQTSVPGRNFFRFAARLQINLLDPETGFFYAGTYFGAKRIFSIGGSVDLQDSYHYYAADLFVDLPAGPGVFTAQVNFAHWNGGTYIPTLPKEYAVMGEVGYNFAGVKISPILRLEQLWNQAASTHVGRYGGGVAWWPYGHNTNLKLFYASIHETGEAHAANQINLQWQVFFF